MTESGKPVENEIIHAKDVTDELDKKVNTSDVLTYEEIVARTDLTGKVPNADSVKQLHMNRHKFYLLDGTEDIRKEYSVGARVIDNVGYI